MKRHNSSNGCAYPKNTLYKPLIASSLALILASSMVHAEDFKVGGSGGTPPSITVSSTETDPTKGSGNLNWDKALIQPAAGTGGTTTAKVEWKNANDTLSIQTTTNGVNDNPPANVAQPVDVTLFALFFGNGNSAILTQNSGAKTIVKGGTNATKIAADFGNKNLGSADKKIAFWLDMGTQGKKTIEVTNLGTLNGDLYMVTNNTSTGKSNTYSLDAKAINGDIRITHLKSTQNSITLKAGEITGNMNISDAEGNTLNATIGNMTGNIGIDGKNFANGKTSTIDFSDKLTGNIMTNKTSGISQGGTLKVTFGESASMAGNLQSSVNYDKARKEVEFKGAGTVLTGNIISYSSGSDLNNNANNLYDATKGNHVTFDKGDMEGSVLAAGTWVNKTNWISRGYNELTFKSGSTQNLTGGLLAELKTQGGTFNSMTTPVTNIINIEANTTLNIKGSGTTELENWGKKVTVGQNNGSNNSGDKYMIAQGSITADTHGRNTINLKENAKLNLDGALMAKNNENASGNLNFDQGASFKGAIKAESKGKINIDMKTTDNTITGNIDLNNATLNLKLGSTVGSTTAGSGGAADSGMGSAAVGTVGAASKAEDTGFTHNINGNISAKNASVVNLDIGKAGAKPGSININGTYNSADSDNSINFFSSATLKANGGSARVKDGKVYVGADAVIENIDIYGKDNNGSFVIGQGAANSGNSMGATGNSSLTITGNTKNLRVDLWGDASSSSNTFNTKLVLKGLDNALGNIKISGKGKNEVILDSTSGDQNTTIASISKQNGNTTGNNISFTLTGNHTSNLTFTSQIPELTGGKNTINFYTDGSLTLGDNTHTFTSTGGTNTLNIGEDGKKAVVATINGDMLSKNTNGSTTINFNTKDSRLSINGTFSSTVSNTGSGKGNIVNMNKDNSVLNLTARELTGESAKAASHTINTLTSSGANNTINLSGQAYGSGTTPARNHFQTLTINKIDGKNPINFILYVNPLANNSDASSTGAKADRIIIEGVNSAAAMPGAEGAKGDGTMTGDGTDADTMAAMTGGTTMTGDGAKGDTGTENMAPVPTSTTGLVAVAEGVEAPAAAGVASSSTPTHYLAITGNAADIIGKDLYTKGDKNNIALATVKNGDSDTPVVEFKATDTISGFSLISFDVISEQTDKDGIAHKAGTKEGGTATNGYTTYFLGTAKSNGASYANQKASAAVMIYI